MKLSSYRSQKTEVKKSLIEGKGLFAIKPIEKGEIVAIKAGHIIDDDEFENYEDVIRDSDLQIADHFYIVPLNKEEFNDVMIFINHSCEPNTGLLGNIIFVAMRNISVGEELTIDYAMIDNNDSSIECNCKATNCRKRITGEDWKIKELQQKYENYFSSYLLEKIRNS